MDFCRGGRAGGRACVLTCDGGELEQVAVQVDVHPRAVVGQGDAGAVPPHRQVLMEAQDQPSQSHLNRLRPGEGSSPPGIVFHQNLEGEQKRRVKQRRSDNQGLPLLRRIRR